MTRKELLAVVHFLGYFKQYLLGRKFRIRTDHAALTWLKRTPDPIGQQARWLEQMEEFDFSIEHRPGTRHGNADALSRRPCPKRECLCQQPVAPLFSGSADPPVSVSAEDREDSAVSNPQLCRSTRLESNSGQDSRSEKVSRTSPHFSGTADRGRPHIQRRDRLWWPAMPPRLETISEEDFVGEFIETELNPEAEPFVPVRETSIAAVQVESSTPVDPPAMVPDLSLIHI